eukprot:g13885.t1
MTQREDVTCICCVSPEASTFQVQELSGCGAVSLYNSLKAADCCSRNCTTSALKLQVPLDSSFARAHSGRDGRIQFDNFLALPVDPTDVEPVAQLLRKAIENAKQRSLTQAVLGTAMAAENGAAVDPGIMMPPRQQSIPESIKALADLRDQGILTEDEFQQKKENLLAQM